MADLDVLGAPFQRAAFGSGAFLRVVNWHNTPDARRGDLRAQLSGYLDHYHPVQPDDLDRFFETGRWLLDRPGFIPAFYDGYRNNVTVAAPVCEELGISAWFFPPTGLLDVPPEDQRAYATAHDVTLLPEEPHAPWWMTWDDLAQIGRRHVVAAHTATHAAARDITTPEDVEREIRQPVRQLTQLTGRVPPAFAFLYGTPPMRGTLAGDAVLACGVRYATTNTAYLRIAD
ncbi:polysaccharide deacetylase family protein [Lapillicoccus sp.]|uniref:polysaccharide deacetylase family protein n=1 Tax=Lapillicoccus sp. TaxID=1909287 RepID=UPI0025F3CF62|nr:polysaccharide deacetylase family protein [Lapillicoccus sp.]